MARPKKKKLGELLINDGLLRREELEHALREQQRTGDRLGKVLARLSRVSEDDIIQVLGRQLGIRSVDFDGFLIDPQILRLVPEKLARRHQAIPIFREDGELVVAMVDPLDVFAIDDLARESHEVIRPAVAREEALFKALEQYYGGDLSVEDVLRSIDPRDLSFMPEEEGRKERLEELAGETPVVKLVNTMLLQAVSDKASDVHLEPDETSLRMRQRIDGLLHEVSSFPRELQPAILSRLKIMANMDIAEKRLAQDGRFGLKVGNDDVDVRAATLPTIHGEKMALRLLDKRSALMSLPSLGMSAGNLSRFEGLLSKPHGIVLVTGPTGSGKTTTLYALLQSLDGARRNIITIEDPVEYQLSKVTQMQVNPRLGITFANGLRSILRQDPDVIMVGEIRDRETAEIAVHSALTGHLVLSTLHTNDAAGALTRLIEMGVEPFLVASAVEGVIGQRLVRLICTECRAQFTPEPEALRRLGLESGTHVFRGEGCERCKRTGYLGRTGIFEVLVMSDRLRESVIKKVATETLRGIARADGYRPLRDEGLARVRSGETSLEEVLRVTFVGEE